MSAFSGSSPASSAGVSRGGDDLPYRRVLVALDGCELTHGVLERGAELAELLGAEVHVVCVQEPPPALQTQILGETPREVFEEHLEEVRSRIREALEGCGVHVESLEVCGGSPAGVILHLLEEGGFDLVVLGRHGRGIRHRFRPGSTTHRVLACAPCPVLVLPCMDEKTIGMDRKEGVGERV
ncbi:MAG: universal stress protein [Rubrobacteraceae bacterium]|nr:universal stress protein [Rubrobacteraceae bacterium]